jgi:hypothetical protein
MGLFDYYEPDPPIECPKCGGRLVGWQGRDTLPALFVWRQGVAEPIDQRVDPDIRALPEKMAALRVSSEFWIYGGECECGFRFDNARFRVRCTAPDGVWRTTEIEPPPTPAHDVGDGRLQCSACCEVWRFVPDRRLYLCPGCGRLTRLGNLGHNG